MITKLLCLYAGGLGTSPTLAAAGSSVGPAGPREEGSMSGLAGAGAWGAEAVAPTAAEVRIEQSGAFASVWWDSDMGVDAGEEQPIQ